MEYAPIILFVYNRLEHTRKTLEALLMNPEAKDCTIYIYSDGPKNTTDELKVNETRMYIDTINGFKNKKVFKNLRNEGLAKSIEAGISRTFEFEKHGIILEDDIIVNRHFIRTMNELLTFHENNERIMHISASIHYEIKTTNNWFFYNVNSCWGWATWKRAWAKYSNDPVELLKKLENKNIDHFIYNGGQSNQFYDQLVHNKNKDLHTWACKWHASIYLHEGKCIHPRISLTKNIGFDGSGTNCGTTKSNKEPFTQEYLRTAKLNIENSDASHIHVSSIFAKKNAPKPVQRLKSRIKNILKKVLAN